MFFSPPLPNKLRRVAAVRRIQRGIERFGQIWVVDPKAQVTFGRIARFFGLPRIADARIPNQNPKSRGLIARVIVVRDETDFGINGQCVNTADPAAFFGQFKISDVHGLR